eukprot:SAG22_NODE_2974_length_2057_cov_1.829928_2_plen_122_part_00
MDDDDAQEAGATWPSVYRLAVIVLYEVAFIVWVGRVFCAASAVTAACNRVLRRAQTLHVSMAIHNPKMQAECMAFHDHVERASVCFKSVGFTVSYHAGASVVYAAVSALMAVTLSILSQDF